jgi:hypothetical protein
MGSNFAAPRLMTITYASMPCSIATLNLIPSYRPDNVNTRGHILREAGGFKEMRGIVRQ